MHFLIMCHIQCNCFACTDMHVSHLATRLQWNPFLKKKKTMWWCIIVTSKIQKVATKKPKTSFELNWEKKEEIERQVYVGDICFMASPTHTHTEFNINKKKNHSLNWIFNGVAKCFEMKCFRSFFFMVALWYRCTQNKSHKTHTKFAVVTANSVSLFIIVDILFLSVQLSLLSEPRQPKKYVLQKVLGILNKVRCTSPFNVEYIDKSMKSMFSIFNQFKKPDLSCARKGWVYVWWKTIF